MDTKNVELLKNKIIIERLNKARRIIPMTFHDEKKFSHVTINKSQTLIALCNDNEKLTILDAIDFECVNLLKTKNAVK